MSKIRFIAYPEATIYEEATYKSKKVKKLLWGDWATLLNKQSGNYIKIKCRNAVGWIHKNKLQINRILEVNFIDVGQGDGCFIVTPNDEFILIDAGVSDNMYRFLRWRFNLSRNRTTIPIKHLIISHPDIDHYKGFAPIVDSPRFKIENIYHNGIVERTGANILGPRTPEGEYLTDILDTHDKLKNLVNQKSIRGGKLYPNLLYRAIFKENVKNVQMLQVGDEIPGYGKNDNVYFEILGPVPKQDAESNNQKWLKYFNNDGETKNGHSVVFKLKYDKVKIFLGGDLNDASEEFLAKHYTGFNPYEVNENERKQMIEKGREVFMADVAKSCHHGSHKFIDDFLSFIYPVATIVSSGDNETHTHPRPDTLGAIGKHSRGKRPLIFSTELARSSKEKLEIKESDLEKISQLYSEKENAIPKRKKEINEEINQVKANIERNVAVYGMIALRTDGKKIIIAQKKEQKGAGFIIHKLEQTDKGDFEFVK